MKYPVVIALLVLFSIQTQTLSAAEKTVAGKTVIDKTLILDFMQAFNSVYQPEMTETDIDRYFAFMTPDVEDHHVSYNVVISGIEGREKSRRGLLNKGKNSISYTHNIEHITLGTAMAVVVFNEDAKYIKNGKEKHFIGRTITILEFNEQGKIAIMRRYQD